MQVPAVIVLALLPDYLFLVKTRRLIRTLQRPHDVFVQSLVLVWDLFLGVILASVVPILIGLGIMLAINHGVPPPPPDLPKGAFYGVFFSYLEEPNMIASLFASVWLWLYAGCDFVLKSMRQVDTAFGRFLRVSDIEHRPLSSIGFVAATVSAIPPRTTLIKRLDVHPSGSIKRRHKIRQLFAVTE